MRNLFITFLILICCTAGAAWAAETIMEEEYTRTFDQGMDRFQEARELLKRNSEQNRRVEQTLARIRAAWGADLKQAPEEVEAPAREHNREIEQSLAKIRAVLKSDFKMAPEELETSVREHNRKFEQTLAIIIGGPVEDQFFIGRRLRTGFIENGIYTLARILRHRNRSF